MFQHTLSWIILSHHSLQVRVSQLEGKRQGDGEAWDFLHSNNSFRADIEGVCNSSLYPFNHPRLGASISVYFLWKGKAAHLITPSVLHLSGSRDLSVRWHRTQYVLCHGRSWAAHTNTLLFCFHVQLLLSPPPRISLWRLPPWRTPISLPLDPLAPGPACPHCLLPLHPPFFLWPELSFQKEIHLTSLLLLHWKESIKQTDVGQVLMVLTIPSVLLYVVVTILTVQIGKAH